MVCLYCGSATRVTNSRAQRRNNHIWRRRACVACAALFTTTERPDLAGSVAVRRHDKQLEPFNRDKLFLAVHGAIAHRQESIEDASAITQIIVADLLCSHHSGEMAVSAIADACRAVLGRFDQSAKAVYDAYHPERPTA